MTAGMFQTWIDGRLGREEIMREQRGGKRERESEGQQKEEA